MPRENRVRKYPFPTFEVDLSGSIKLRTLEHFAYASTWHTRKQFLKDPVVAEWENLTPGKRTNVRLLRYYRAGLLNRRRKEGRYEYEYRLSPKGEDRYIYMLKSRGLLDPTKAKNPDEKELALNRLAVVKLLLMRQRRRLESGLARLDLEEPNG
ncbi:MAG: hypothetical protein ABSB56_06595 [Nitrososphaerales archaeon]|jgi:hypothetical protein